MFIIVQNKSLNDKYRKLYNKVMSQDSNGILIAVVPKLNDYKKLSTDDKNKATRFLKRIDETSKGTSEDIKQEIREQSFMRGQLLNETQLWKKSTVELDKVKTREVEITFEEAMNWLTRTSIDYDLPPILFNDIQGIQRNIDLLEEIRTNWLENPGGSPPSVVYEGEYFKEVQRTLSRIMPQDYINENYIQDPFENMDITDDDIDNFDKDITFLDGSRYDDDSYYENDDFYL